MGKSENKLLISIVMPVYNAEKYMDHAIDCILQQTYSNWELILVDNCSTDSTVEKCQEWISKDNRIFGIFHEKNLGLGQSRTDGINFAHGDYIGFMDSDDYIHPQFLEIMSVVAKKSHSKIVMCEKKAVCGDYKVDFKTIDSADIHFENYKLEKIYYEMFNSSVTEGPYLVVWTKIFRTDVAKKIHVTFHGAEDTYFCFKAYNKVRELVYIKNQPLYFYSVRENSEYRSSFNVNHYMTLIVYLKMEKETYYNNYQFYHFVSSKTYKKFLSTRCDCVGSELEQQTLDLINKEFPPFRKRFLQCKKIPFYQKLMMDILYYFPFTYSWIKR